MLLLVVLRHKGYETDSNVTQEAQRLSKQVGNEKQWRFLPDSVEAARGSSVLVTDTWRGSVAACKAEEVDDEAFYSTPSLVFTEAENRTWAHHGFDGVHPDRLQAANSKT
ncbi:ornithine transcarbamylase, mitochondrial-like [Xyrauchen texanus]|uniref:ornithine transcarbamylase, mitochondrial-like n=1 Tax=Xyrauchen texanus TaxID=154827 RepID=UPI002242BD8D|nr:ornithine transcarbamylase, mitochondrial-like [Xyrauchen texanus]